MACRALSALYLPPTLKERAPGFLISWPTCRARGEKVRLIAVTCGTPENGVRLFARSLTQDHQKQVESLGPKAQGEREREFHRESLWGESREKGKCLPGVMSSLRQAIWPETHRKLMSSPS